MADGLFGTPTGFRTYDRDQAELGLLASQTRHQDALTGLNKAQAQVALQKQAGEDAKTAALAKIASGSAPEGAPTFDSLIESANKTAAALFAAGDYEGAQKATADAARALASVSAAGASQARQATSEAALTSSKIDRLQQLLSGVNGPESHAAFLMAAKADPLLGEDPLPPALMRYDPRTIEAFRTGSEALRRQVATQSDAIRTQAYVADKASAAGRRAILNAQGERKTQAYVERTERLGKTGAGEEKPAGPPSSADVKAMTADLKTAGLLAGGPAGEAQAVELAERAKRLVWASKGALTGTEARAQAIREAEAAGEIDPPEEKFFGRDKPGAFKPTLGSLTRPRDAKPGITAKVGEYVRDPATGEVRQATAAGWKLVTPGRNLKAPLPANPLAEDDGEDEE